MSMVVTEEMSEDDLIPRDYQVELMNRAINENTIIYLPTGSGKTYVAVLVLKRLAAALDKSDGNGKISAVLVNSVPLVDQHTSNLKKYTPFDIGAYSGDMNVDFWDKQKWLEEFKKHQVFVMTAQIFLNIITSSFLNLEQVNLIIFDECHHGVEDQVMRQLMKCFENVVEQPRVLGLTATLLNKNCTIRNVMEQVNKLEITYNSKVATASHLQKVFEYSTSPEEKLLSYSEHRLSSTEELVISFLEELSNTIENVKVDQPSKQNNGDLQELDGECRPRLLINHLKDIVKSINEFGMFGGFIALKYFMILFHLYQTKATNVKVSLCLSATITLCLKAKDKFQEVMKASQDKVNDYSSPKIKMLFKILRLEAKSIETFRGIIFVERRSTAKILYHVIDQLKKSDAAFGFIKANFIVGFANNPNSLSRVSLYTNKMARRILDSFANGDINLLISTGVIEEGVDVPGCTFVCKFDKPVNYRSYIQSKGRARSKGGRYYIMELDNCIEKFRNLYQSFQEVEHYLNTELQESNDVRQAPPESAVQDIYMEDEMPPYHATDDPRSACITMLSAISLLCRYCQLLSSDLYTIQQPKWFLDKSCTNAIKVVIELPTVCPLIDRIEGTSKSKRNAKRKAALIGCMLLHKLGEFDENLIPKDRTILENVEHLFNHWSNDQVASTKKEAFVKELPRCTKGNIKPNEPVYLHLIQIRPKFPNNCPTNALMLTLYESNLTYGLISGKRFSPICDFPLYVSQGEINISLEINYKRLQLTAEQLDGIKKFNTLVFDEILKILNPFLLIDMNNDENKIFCVPVDRTTDYDIDFKIIAENEKLVPISEPTGEQRQNMLVNDETYLQKIVTPWYRNGQTNYIVKEVTNLNATSQFPCADQKTYSEYFLMKYEQRIVNESNPLLLVKAISNRLNCIKPRGTPRTKRKIWDDQDYEDIHLIPELCVKQELPAALWVQAHLLPTILERVYLLLLVEELRERIRNEIELSVDKETVWQPLIGRHYEHYEDKTPPQTSVIMNMPINEIKIETVNLSSSKLNKEFKLKMLERQYPWKDIEEPIDIERNLDVNLLDVEGYANFITTGIHDEDRELKNRFQNNLLMIEYHKNFVHKDIRSISIYNNSSPCQREVLEAICTAKANDIVNLERYETLGDSFLKLIVSIYVYLKYPKYDEGKATILKSKIISNNNLYLLGKRKRLGGILKASDFDPSHQWIPPGFTIPSCIKEANASGNFPSKYIYRVYLSDEDKLAGELTDDSYKYIFSSVFMDDDDGVGDANHEHTSEYFFNRQSIAKKTIADVVESLLGVYFKSCGLNVAINLLEWFEIIPKTEQLRQLMKTTPPSPVLKVDAKQNDIDFLIPSWKQLEGKLGYSFKNRAYLLQALTHSSFSPNRITRSYEMLEFVGDAVLDFLITCFIFETCGDLTPGELTDLRSALVNNITFACYTVRCEFHKYLLLLNKNLENDIYKFVAYQESNQYAVTDNVLILVNEEDIHMAENVDCPKILGDIFEALVGAVYLDSGHDLNVVWKVFYKIMWQEIEMFSNNVPKNVVRSLYETPGTYPKFSPPEPVDRVMMVKLDLMISGERKRVYGFGDNKKNAKRAASKVALQLLHN